MGGILLLLYSSFVRLTHGVIWPWGFGMGIGLVLGGGIQLFYWYDGRAYTRDEAERRNRRSDR